jgi:hypothetical protein
MRDNYENLLTRSILGDPEVFEKFLDDDLVPQSRAPSPKKAKGTPDFVSTASFASKKKSLAPQPSEAPNPTENPQLYLDALKKLKMKAGKLRARELEKEANLVQYLPVNERFDLNKEGKVLAMWQERQKKWSKIQRALASRSGKDRAALMMNTGDEFRARNEEYDILQAAIPLHERFGADSWMMTLRGGNSRNVSIGHVFSGLSCPVSAKVVIPPTIRKPHASSGSTLRKSNTFIDPTPSLLLRQKQLHKTLTTIRPHNIGPNEVEGFAITSQNLFDWAIESSQSFFRDLSQHSLQEREKEKFLQQSLLYSKTPPEPPPYAGSQLTFISSRNILFSGLQGQTVHQVVSFQNTGPSAMTYIWKSVPEKELHEPSDVAIVLSNRKDKPRAHLLSKERSPFFCPKAVGQILPGDIVETVFSFYTQGSGGNFQETWMLDTIPRAVVHYPPTFSRGSSFDANLAQGRHLAAVSLPSTVYIKLKGHAETLDEHQHRRDAVSRSIGESSKRENMNDEAYQIVRRIRFPVTSEQMKQRKLDLFKRINSDIFRSACQYFVNLNEVRLTNDRFAAFVHLRGRVIAYAESIMKEFEFSQATYKSTALQSVDAQVMAPLQRLFAESDVALQSHIREALFPEKTIVCANIYIYYICFQYLLTPVIVRIYSMKLVRKTLRAIGTMT